MSPLSRNWPTDMIDTLCVIFGALFILGVACTIIARRGLHHNCMDSRCVTGVNSGVYSLCNLKPR